MFGQMKSKPKAKEVIKRPEPTVIKLSEDYRLVETWDPVYSPVTKDHHRTEVTRYCSKLVLERKDLDALKQPSYLIVESEILDYDSYSVAFSNGTTRAQLFFRFLRQVFLTGNKNGEKTNE